MTKTSFEDTLFRPLVTDPNGAGGLSAAQAEHEPATFLRHAGSLSMSKIADGLIDPKLVLAWLLAHSGADAVVIFALVLMTGIVDRATLVVVAIALAALLTAWARWF